LFIEYGKREGLMQTVNEIQLAAIAARLNIQSEQSPRLRIVRARWSFILPGEDTSCVGPSARQARITGDERAKALELILTSCSLYVAMNFELYVIISFWLLCCALRGCRRIQNP
jgi:hypothetical protein